MNHDKIGLVLADDRPAVRAGIRHFLEHDPSIEIRAEARDGIEAHNLIKKLHPDVAILELQMSQLSGLDLLRQLRSEESDVRVLLFTDYDEDSYVYEALQAGAKGYLLKTCGREELIRSIHLVYSNRIALDSKVMERFVGQLGEGNGDGVSEHACLTERELQVLRVAAQGMTNRAIGSRLQISERTVHSHLINIFAKLGVKNRTEAVLKAIRLGWLSIEDTAKAPAPISAASHVF